MRWMPRNEMDASNKISKYNTIMSKNAQDDLLLLFLKYAYEYIIGL